MKILVTYHSLSGNTRATADMIKENIVGQGYSCLVSQLNYSLNVEDFDLIYIGSYTWGEGLTPDEVRKYLKYILIENEFNLPKFAVFGTGETQWTHYCRAVDEIEYHLSKKTGVLGKLKIEQHPVNQQKKVAEFVKQTLKEMSL